MIEECGNKRKKKSNATERTDEMEEKQLVLRQTKRMIFMELFSMAAFIMPYITVSYGGTNGIYVLFFGLGMLLFLGSYFYIVSNLFPEGYEVWLKENKDVFFGRVTGAVYGGRFLIRGIFAAEYFIALTKEYLLPKGSNVLILLCFFGVILFGNCGGVLKRAKTLEFLYWWMVFPFLLILFLGIWQISWDKIVPQGNFRIGVGLSGGLELLCMFLPCEFLLFSLPHTKGKGKAGGLFGVFVLISIFMTGIYLITMGTLGEPLSFKSLWSGFQSLSFIPLPGGFLQRFELFLLLFWMLGMFALMGAYSFYGAKMCSILLPESKEFKMELFFLLLVVLIAANGSKLQDSYEVYRIYMRYVDVWLAIFLPLVVYMRKRKKEAKTE